MREILVVATQCVFIVFIFIPPMNIDVQQFFSLYLIATCLSAAENVDSHLFYSFFLALFGYDWQIKIRYRVYKQ